MRWAGGMGARCRVTPGSSRLTLGLWVHGGRGLSLFSAFLMVLSHSNGSSLPSSLFIKQVLGAIQMYRDSFTFLSCNAPIIVLPHLPQYGIRWGCGGDLTTYSLHSSTPGAILHNQMTCQSRPIPHPLYLGLSTQQWQVRAQFKIIILLYTKFTSRSQILYISL